MLHVYYVLHLHSADFISIYLVSKSSTQEVSGQRGPEPNYGKDQAQSNRKTQLKALQKEDPGKSSAPAIAFYQQLFRSRPAPPSFARLSPENTAETHRASLRPGWKVVFFFFSEVFTRPVVP